MNEKDKTNEDERDESKNMSVFIIVRERPSIKNKLLNEAYGKGYTRLSDYVRMFWRHLH